MDNELVYIGEGREAVTTSVLVADAFGKKHKHVMSKIHEILGSAQNSAHLFLASVYQDTQGKQRPMYIMNRDGFTLLAMSFTGETALQFKLKYIEAFNKMEAQLKEIQNIPLPSYQIEDPIARAEAWINEQKEKKQLMLENESRKAEIVEKDNRLKIARDLYNEERPLVNYSKGVLAESKLLEVHELGKMLSNIKELGMGPKKIWTWLRDHKYIMRFSTEPYQEFITKKRFFAYKAETKRNLFGFGTHTESKTFLTPEGRVHIVNEIFQEKGINNSQQLSLKFE